MAVKVLQVVSTLDLGGIEKWLLNLTSECRQLFGDQLQFEFLTLLKEEGYYRERLAALGCPVHHCQLSWKALPLFARDLRRVLRQGGYDAVHCQADYLGGVVLPIARRADVPRRFCHIHTTRFKFAERRPLGRYLAGRLLRKLSIRHGSLCIGCSQNAVDAYLDGVSERGPTAVVFCGIVLAEFQTVAAENRTHLREQLGWPPESRIVLHVGRHTEEKNLGFLMEIYRELATRNERTLLVLAGQGPLTESAREAAQKLGLDNHVRFLGNRDDIPKLMRAADLLLLPSIFEGLPVTVVEAQATGLRSLIADHITPEVEIVPGMVSRLPLPDGAARWAEQVERLLTSPAPDHEACLRAVEASRFNLRNSALELMEMYSGAR